MTDRYPPIPPSELTPEQKKAYDECSQTAEDLFGNKMVYKNDKQAFIGPFSPLLYTPTLMDPFLRLVIEAGKLPNFPPAAKETAIVATGSHFKAGYELYAHGKIAASTSLSESQIKSIKEGVLPDGLDEQCAVAFDVARELAKGGGPLSQKNWERAVKAFGKEGTAALIQYVGLYAYTCVLLNGVDASVPKDD